MPELAVIVPTLNERDNLTLLVARLEQALAGIDFEITIVDDDSKDGTAALARQLAQRNPRLRAIQRLGRRGLSGAVIEGMMATSAPYLAVIDGDLQHDERALPQLLAAVRDGNAELAVGTRNAEAGSMGDFAPHRVALSSLGRRLSGVVCKTEVSDPMSGFFLLRRSLLDEVVPKLSLTGFKILVDILASAGRPVRTLEVPYRFGDRQHGESKLDTLVAVEYLLLLVHKMTAGFAPVSYVTFGIVGAVGVLANSVLLQTMLARGASFGLAQSTAGAIVIVINFLLNNQVTFRPNRLRKARQWVGLAIYSTACGAGLALNVNLAATLRRGGLGELASGAAGIVAGSVWNYWAVSLLVWRVGRAERVNRWRSAPAELPSESLGPSLENLGHSLQAGGVPVPVSQPTVTK